MSNQSLPAFIQPYGLGSFRITQPIDGYWLGQVVGSTSVGASLTIAAQRNANTVTLSSYQDGDPEWPDTHVDALFKAEDGYQYKVLDADLEELAVQVSHFLLGKEVIDGDFFTDWVKGGRRQCQVIQVKVTRFHCIIEMPAHHVYSTRRGVRVGDMLFYDLFSNIL